MALAPLPPATVPVLDQEGQFTLPWRRWLQQSVGSETITPAQLVSLLSQVAQALAQSASALAQSEINITDILAIGAGDPMDGLNPLTLLGVAASDLAGA